MADSSKITLFEKTPVPKAVMTLAIPTVISSLVMVIYNLTDTYFVGMVNDPIQNAAVTFAAPILLAFNAINNLFGVGASSMMSRALGRKDYETVSRSSAFGFYCALIFGILFSLAYFLFSDTVLTLLGTEADAWNATAAYMQWTVALGAAPAILNVVISNLVRSEGSTLQASIGTMSGCLINIVLDPLFILGLDMGAQGAGLATFIGNCCACIYFFVLLYVRRKKTVVCINPKMFSFKKDIVQGVFIVGVPAMIQNLLNVLGMTILNNFIAAYGSTAVAAMGIAQKVNQVAFYIALGFSQGIMPLISYNYADKNAKRVKETIRFSYITALAFMILMMVIYQSGSSFIISLFMENETVIAYGGAFLRGFSLALPFITIDFVAVGIFNACGLGGRTFIFAILRKIVLEIPFLFLLDALFPMYGLAYAQACAEMIMSIIAVIVLWKVIKNLPDREKEVRI